MTQRRKRVAVVGQNEPDVYLEGLAYEVGRLLALAGCLVYCGGRGGVMEAACRGVDEAGGISVGILPSDDVATGNAFVDIPVATGMGEARNAIIVNSVEGVIAVGRGYGTLSEIALALRRGLPVVLLRSWTVEGDAQLTASAEEAVATVLRLIG